MQDSQIEQRPQAKWGVAPKPFPNFAVIVMGLVAAIGGCLLSQGNGLPPFTYFVIGAVLLPLAANSIVHSFCKVAEKPKRWQIAVTILGSLGCFLLAYMTSRRPPTEIFEHVFEMTPPTSVQHFAGRRQWYDGEMWLLSFVANEADFAKLIENVGVKRDDEYGDDPSAVAAWTESQWRVHAGVWSSIAYDYWSRTAPTSPLEFYRIHRDEAFGESTTINVIRDPKTQRVWAVRLD